MPPLYLGEPLRTTTLPVDGPLPQISQTLDIVLFLSFEVASVGFAGLPFDVGESVVESGGETAEAFAAGRLGLDRSDFLARGLGFKRLDLIVGHRHSADRKTDTALATINLDNTSLDFLADIKSILDLLDAVVGDLGDVNKTVHAVLELDERAEGSDLGNLA